jgi:tellurite methyltransferase
MDVHLTAKGLYVERFLRNLSHSCQYNAAKERGLLAESPMSPEEDGKAKWNQRYRESPGSWVEADSFLIRAHDEFLSDAAPGLALDLAGGAGRNAIWLAERGWRVRLVDLSDVGLKLAREKLPRDVPGDLQTESVDLDSVLDLGNEQYDLIVVFYFLRRELFPAIARALKPGGSVIYRTYTIDRMNMPGGPSDPAYLLQPNELLHAFRALRVLHYHEMVEGKAAAEIIARK